MVATKKATGAAAANKKAATGQPSYKDMIRESIISLKERNGTSRQALKKYILGNFKPTLTGSSFDAAFNKAIKTGVEKGDFTQPKGPSGPVKLAKKEAAAAPKPAAPKPAAAKPAATKTETSAKKAAAGKKGAAKAASSATAKAKMSAGGKKGAAKTNAKTTTPAAKKANTATKRKTPASAPAVVEQATVLNKTKSGRVSKGKAPPPGSTSAKRSVAGKKGAAKSPASKKKEDTKA